MNRRSILTCLAATTLGATLVGPVCGCASAPSPNTGVMNRNPTSAFVAWFSQTGHTARLGRLIAKTLEDSGLQVTTGDLRQTDPAQAAAADLLVVGSPVQYAALPYNVAQWLAKLPSLAGKAAAAFVTYGGDGTNQHNTKCALLEALASHGAAPVGASGFSNMNTFTPFLVMGGRKRILAFRHLPDQTTFEQGRAFARQTLEAVRTGQAIVIDREFDLAGLVGGRPMRVITKMGVSRHKIDLERCTRCGACLRACPMGAVDLEAGTVDGDTCILCLGCLNNCPTGAMTFVYLGRDVIGWRQFCAQEGIEIADPPELLEG